MTQAFGVDTVRLSWPLLAIVPSEYERQFRKTRSGFRCLQRQYRSVRIRIVETPQEWKVTVCGSLARMAHGHNRIPLRPDDAPEAARQMLELATEVFPFLASPDLTEVKVQRLDLAMSTTIPYTKIVAEGILKASARIGHKRPRVWRGRWSSTYYSHQLSRGDGEPYSALCVYGKPFGAGWRGPRLLRIEVRFYSGVLGYRLDSEERTLDRLSANFQILVPLAIRSLQREFRWIRPIEMRDLRRTVAKLGNRGPREGRIFLRDDIIDFVWFAQKFGALCLIEDEFYDLEAVKILLTLLSDIRIGVGDPEIPELAMFADVLGV